MSKSVVIFGPAKVGKSTLVGYLIFKYRSNFNLGRFISDTKMHLGDKYEESQKFSYITDTARDERQRTGGLLVSKRMHIEPIRIDDYEITILDTPGAQHAYRERTKGICLGETGVFMIELSKLTKEDLLSWDNIDTLRDFFTPLSLWLKFRDKKRLVVVISKMDERAFNFSEDKFKIAVDTIKTLFKGVNIDIIPLSIDVKDEKEHNLLSRSEKMLWYSGPTLINKLKEIFENNPPTYLEKPLFFFVERQFNEVPLIGRAWRGKVLQGRLKKGSSIKMIPVEYKNRKDVAVLAEVKSIRYEKDENTEIAERGSIVGIDLHNIKIGDKRLEKDDFNSIATSCIIDPEIPVFAGNVLRFKVPSEETEKLNILEYLHIIWFGKIISSQIVDIKQMIDYGLITVELINLNVKMPLDNNKFFFDTFILKKDNDHFIKGILERLGSPYIVTMPLENINDKKDIIFKYFTGFKYELLKNELKFVCDDSLINLVKKLKRYSELERPGYESWGVNIEIKEVKEI